MPKAIVSNRIYMDLPIDKNSLFDALTYRIVNNDGSKKYEQIEIIRNYRMITPNIVSIPQARYDLIPPGYEIIDKRILEFEDFPVPKYDLFPEQQIVYDQVEDTCFINALVGWGKTITALHIAYKWGQKTLVVTHTTALRDQWIEEVEKLFGFKPGIIAAGTFEINAPIVVGNVQSIVRNLPKIEKAFGTVIMDEAHHTPATTFTSIIDKSHARYRLALSGTMQRKDGKHVLFPDYFSSRVFKPEQSNTMTPSIKLLKTGIKLPAASTWADKITKLLADKEYQELIASLALVQANKGHKVLVIADRVEFLKSINDMMQHRSTIVVGETADRKTELNKIASGQCDIMCGSRQIFSEGISQNELSCLILAVPIVNTPTLEQVIGRIMRLSEGKLNPVVIDLQFSGQTEKVQNNKRIAFYLEKGWSIEAL